MSVGPRSDPAPSISYLLPAVVLAPGALSQDGKPIQLDVIDRMARVDVILGALSIRVHVGDQVLRCVPEEELGKTSTDQHPGCARSDNRVSVHLPALIVTIVRQVVEEWVSRFKTIVATNLVGGQQKRRYQTLAEGFARDRPSHSEGAQLLSAIPLRRASGSCMYGRFGGTKQTVAFRR
jgi:hypothetical protein